jgi:hypothetical protein
MPPSPWIKLIRKIPDKAPYPDGFTGVFFKKCWDIIKDNGMCAIHQFNTLHMARVQWVNYKNIVVFPKRGAKMSISYRPISLIHAIAKKSLPR